MPPIPGPEEDPDAPRVPVTIERALAALAMAAICLVTFGNVVVRYFTNVSFAFTEEYAIFLMVVMTFLGSAAAVAADRHIRITALVDRLPRAWRRWTDVAAWTSALIMFAVIIWYGGRLTYDQWRFEETSPGLGNPQWLYTVWMPVLAGVVALRVLGRIVRLLRRRRA
ncbi:TRAP transporter small permease [Azospirillum halopraeferens]|uniref:TRAP transporter small permease n=1 Tax=Azospirillum halopraeferens TaxID=34010 RepID=UPI00041C514D|nr:TRAP transporter small permease [Azospirillum halopraeferens]